MTTPAPAPTAGTIAVTAAPGSTIAVEPTAAPIPTEPVVQVRTSEQWQNAVRLDVGLSAESDRGMPGM